MNIFINHPKIILIVFLMILSTNIFAGNQDRSGQAGAPELLINPWSRSTGWEGANAGCVRGLESIYLNVAGLAFTTKTELVFAHTLWLEGTGIQINSFGIAQRAGEASVLGLSVMSMDFGDIPMTTVGMPDGGLGNFSPRFININMAYSRTFSQSIFGGINIKLIQEAIPNLKAQGIALDAGIQYVTGVKENIKFGISLKNIGPQLIFSGDGLSYQGSTSGSNITMTLQQRSSELELPSLIKIGAAYDFHLSKDDIHILTAAFTFTSNSFTKDQFSAGLEYGLKSVLFLRIGYTYEEGNLDPSTRTNVYIGPSAGFSVDVPLRREKNKKFSFDYSYRATSPFAGTHSFGVNLNF